VIYWFTGASIQAVSTGAYRAVEFIKQNIKLEGSPEGVGGGQQAGRRDLHAVRAEGDVHIFLTVFFATLSFAFLEPYLFVGYLISIALFGLYQAIFMANAGGAWDNAKKIVEVELKEKGSPLPRRHRGRRHGRRSVQGHLVGGVESGDQVHHAVRGCSPSSWPCSFRIRPAPGSAARCRPGSSWWLLSSSGVRSTVCESERSAPPHDATPSPDGRRGSMRYMTRTIALAATVALSGGGLALAANAQHHPAGGGAHKWTPGQGWDHFAATFDANKDGKVTKDELLAKSPGFDHFDTNKDGVVTADEVKALPASTKHPAVGNFVAKFDSDKDGKVTKQEWDAKRAAGFDAADKNHDGSIDQGRVHVGRPGAGRKHVAGPPLRTDTKAGTRIAPGLFCFPLMVLVRAFLRRAPEDFDVSERARRVGASRAGGGAARAAHLDLPLEDAPLVDDEVRLSPGSGRRRPFLSGGPRSCRWRARCRSRVRSPRASRR